MKTLHCAVLLGMSSLYCANPVLAQAIAPAPDGTGTIVTLDGNSYHIDGGTQAGENLFHSFQKFGLSSGEIANFLSDPRITNILGRVTGGDPSVINGLIQATPNLYLINPAGIVFGAGASLNVGGDFLATTSDRIGFEGGWFNAMGANDYTTLIGNPNQFSFLSAEPSAIVNTGTLTSNQDITLLGGTVINGGAIAAPTVTLAAVPGSRLVNVAQAGMLLSLDLPQEALTAGISPMDLPSLLTAGGVELQGSIVTGDVHLAGPVIAEQADLFAAGRVTVDAPDLVSGKARVVRFSESGHNPDQAVFIDARADNPEALLFGAEAGTIAQIIDRDENGIATITEQLSLISDAVGELESVAIVAEGNQGNFWLGNQWINSENVENYQTQLRTWSDSLTEGADLLLYSCFTALGATGEAFIASLAAITGAEVAASTNRTGSSNYGGDWVLESSTGTIEAIRPFTDRTLSRWHGTLANQTVSNLNDAGTGSLRQALALVGNNESVTFSVSGTVNLLSTISWMQIGVTIDGNGSTVQGSGPFGIFNISATMGTTTINNLTITGGTKTGSGGGISSGGNVSLTNSTVSGNFATGGGGGISSLGNVSLTNSTISDNYTTNYGGGISSLGNVSLTNSAISVDILPH